MNEKPKKVVDRTNVKRYPKPRAGQVKAFATASVTMDWDMLDVLEQRRLELRMGRSEFIRACLEDRLGIISHPELRNPDIKTVLPVTSGFKGPSTLGKAGQ